MSEMKNGQLLKVAMVFNLLFTQIAGWTWSTINKNSMERYKVKYQVTDNNADFKDDAWPTLASSFQFLDFQWHN